MSKITIKKWIWIVPVLMIVLLVGLFFIYTGQYYHAHSTALSSLESDLVIDPDPSPIVSDSPTGEEGGSSDTELTDPEEELSESISE